jgi:polysaccharide export outer membrane protein
MGGTHWRVAPALALVVALHLGGCSGRSDLPPPGLELRVAKEGAAATPAYATPYVIQPEDELKIVVLGAPELTATVPVRSDGTISAPGVGDVSAAGRTPHELALELEARLARLLRHPQVDVLVTKTSPLTVFVSGEVIAGGEKPYRPGMTLLQALAAAGGPRNSARLSQVLLLRRVGPEELEVRRIDMEAVLDRKEGSVDPLLRPMDVVFVPKSPIASWAQFVDQYINPAIDPFTLYIQAWWALNLSRSTVRVTFR